MNNSDTLYEELVKIHDKYYYNDSREQLRFLKDLAGAIERLIVEYLREF